MRLVLPEALHARPANLLVRLADRHRAVAIELRKGERRADARKILEVLALGAAKGDEIEVLASGEGAHAALVDLEELVTRHFDADLVPETGSGAAPGIATGRALVVSPVERAPRERGTTEEELARLDVASVRAVAELEALMTGLSPEERELFEPEKAIVREIAEEARAHIDAGATAEQAVMTLTESRASDLLLDTRARLVGALADDDGAHAALLRAESLGDDVIVVAEILTPSLVAALPGRVRGVIAIDDTDGGPAPGRGPGTSHAAILARGRELPLVLVPAHVAMAIAEGERVVVDTISVPARVWVEPSASLLADARARSEVHAQQAHGDVAQAVARVSQALGVALFVNVGSLHDRVPKGAAGVGLLRTELLFADRNTAPSVRDQLAAFGSVARNAGGNPVTVRLWDAGGDKPLPWLPAGAGDARGAALLFEHPAILRAQVFAIARAAERAPLRILIPMTRHAGDVRAVRARAPGVEVGAMIETPEAARDADAIAEAADFVCIGTNDLAALVLGEGRSDARQALDPRVLVVIRGVVEAAHARGKRVTVCGELAASERGAPVLVGLGVDGLSVAPPRLRGAAAALAGLTVDECRAALAAALAC
jgi:phosphotransferase system HPr (HPr) family protein